MNPPRQSPVLLRRVLYRRGEGGFALLVTIVLVAFLVLILVGLASFTRVETQVASNSQAQAQARQNALMALNIALGQLQRHTGPDQRVTATADLQPLATTAAINDPASGVALDVAQADTATALAAIDDFWRASRNRRWTGVWRDPDPDRLAYDANTPSASIGTPLLLNWLVSGNENVPNTFNPATQVGGLTFSAVTASDAGLAPLYDSANTPYRLLVGAATAGIAVPADLDRAVVAPQIEIKSADVAGFTGEQTVGHYAWWVGDEGVKARADIIDPNASDSTDETNRRRLQSPPRSVLEAMTVTGASAGTDDQRGLAPFKTILANNSELLKVFSPSQLKFLEDSPVYRGQIQKRWHDLSLSSRGVLADVRHGGLRHDLTYLLSRPDLSAFQTALSTALPGFGINTGANAHNRILSTAATPYAILPPLLTSPGGAFGGNNVYQNMDMFRYGATWEQLWSYYNMGNATGGSSPGVFVADDLARPRVHSATRHGLHPLLVQVKLFYKLRMDGNSPDGDGVDRTSNIWVDIIPVAVLANPYNVDLEAQDYILRSTIGGTGRIRLYHGLNLADPEATDLKIDPASYPAPTMLVMNDNGLGVVKLTLKAPRMEAGRAYAFTLQNALTTIPASAADQQSLVVNLVPGFNLGNALTFNTTRRIAASPATQAALTTDNGSISFRLHTSDYTPALGDQTLIRSVVPHTYVIDSAGNTALVYPFSSGLRHGGGMGFFIHDASNANRSQQAVFTQLNYRGIAVDNAAYTSFGNNPNGTGQSDIAISWARTRVKNGASSFQDDDSPNEHLQSHLLWRDPSDPEEVRWGIFNTGEGFDGTVVPASLSGDAGLENILYDVPRAETRPTGITQLRHFNTAGHISRVNWSAPNFEDKFATVNHSFQPNYPIGNSYPNPYIIRQKVIDGDGGMGFQYDGSYLLNDALQDRFYFSTYPQTGDFDFTVANVTNHRHRPFRLRSDVPWDDTAAFRADSRSAALNLLLDGAFNINSTSVDAWKTVLSSLRDIPVGDESAAANLTAPFARTLFQSGRADSVRDGNTVNAWTGTINLSPDEINELANEIVLQIRRRGPFVSLADFINRRPVAAAADATFGRGLSGALQSAIDRLFNQQADVQPVALQQKTNTRAGVPTATPPIGGNRRLAEDAFILPTGISGFAGYIFQSDILVTIGSLLSARSDTFTIRTYGDSVSPASGDVLARAWCEAVVQRVPDYVDSTPAAAVPVAGSPAEVFGRRYQIISFRWLNHEDL
jgi:hypothetical protein